MKLGFFEIWGGALPAWLLGLAVSARLARP